MHDDVHETQEKSPREASAMTKENLIHEDVQERSEFVFFSSLFFAIIN